MNQVYFDNAATTPLREEVINTMTQVLRNTFGNASSTHGFGRSAKALLESSRKQIASHFNCSASEIVFTSGGTEGSNLVLQSAVNNLGVEHIISSKMEHHAVLHTIEHLEASHGIEVSYVKTDHGVVDLNHLESLLKKGKKTLVSLMHINNEIGVLLNLEEVANLCKQNNALFHSDTVQSIGHYRLDLQKIPVDFVTASAHKFHGPKGIGFLFIRKNSGLKPIIFGGEQERGYRAGTESLHNIVGMTEALNLCYGNLEEESTHIQTLKDYFVKELKAAIPDIQFNANSDSDRSSFTILNVRLPLSKSKGDLLQFQLDLKGIASSRGSACQSGSSQGSHVLAEILSPEELVQPSIRFSFSVMNTKKEVDYVVHCLKEMMS